MKTKYIAPCMEIQEIIVEKMIATSGVYGNGIGYGGIDEDGIIVPSSNDRRGSWGDLWNYKKEH